MSRTRVGDVKFKRRRRLLGSWVPTKYSVIRSMLQLANITSEDVVYDLGCGDGRILIMAVKDFGAKRGIGYELRIEQYNDALDKIKKEDLQNKITIHNEDMFTADLHDASVIMLYTGGKANQLLRPIIEKKTQPGVRIVSHQFKIYSWKIEDEQNTSHDSDIQIFLYRLPQK